jgi:anti-sigma factor RsiW
MTDISRSPSYEELVDLVEGRLSSEAEEQVRSRAAAHASAAEELAETERLIGLMRNYSLQEAPSPVIARAARLMRQSRPAQPSLRQRVVALLRFDSWQQPAAAAVRTGQNATRQILFYAEGYDVDVRVTPAGSTWVVTGQVLGPNTGGAAELHGPLLEQTTLNDMSKFTFSSVPSGTYTLTLRLEEIDVEIAGLELQS